MDLFRRLLFSKTINHVFVLDVGLTFLEEEYPLYTHKSTPVPVMMFFLEEYIMFYL